MADRYQCAGEKVTGPFCHTYYHHENECQLKDCNP